MELIYSHPNDDRLVPRTGNHEYRGTHRRYWTTPTSVAAGPCSARYYTKAFEDKGTTIRIVWIDTAPMMDKYRNDSATYPDACKQDLQNNFLDRLCTDQCQRLDHRSRTPSHLCRNLER